MKKCLRRTLSLLLTLVMIASVCAGTLVNTSALTYVSGANSVSYSYSQSKYYRNVTSIPLSGDGRQDAIAVALSQLGYQEGAYDGDYSGLTCGYNNYTEFCYNMGSFGSGYTYDWCATFCAWALLQSGATTQNSISSWCRNYLYTNGNYIWREVGCAYWRKQLEYFGYFQSSGYTGNSYIPQTGDLIFFSWSGAYSAEDHIGMVVYSDGTNVYTIEGNTGAQSGLEAQGEGVHFKSYPLNYYYITGYGTLPYVDNPDVPDVDYSGNTKTTGLYMTRNYKYIYSSETATSYSYLSEINTVCEVTQIMSNGRLKANIYTTDGSYVTGYILPEDLIQLTATSGASSGGSISHTAVMSSGASYTTTAPDRGDIYDDNGSRLTDGISIPADPATDGCSGWSSHTNTVEVVLDLGTAKWTNNYNVYFAGGAWGIGLPDSDVTVEVQVSNDNYNFETVSPAGSGYYYKMSGSGVVDETWSFYNYYANIRKDVKARYIKFIIDHTKDGFVWLTEVDAVLSMANDNVVTGFDTVVTGGSSIIFTPDFNGGVLTETNTNTTWTTNVVVEWNNTLSQYVVVHKENGLANGWTLKNNQLLIATHAWEGDDIDGSVTGSNKNYSNLNSNMRYQVGDIVRLNGINLSDKTLDETAAYAESVSVIGDVNRDLMINALDYILVKRGVLGTYELTSAESLNADIDATGATNATDYTLLRRYCLGTYAIKQNF